MTVLGNDVSMRNVSSDRLNMAQNDPVSGRISVGISYTVKRNFQRDVLNFEVGHPVLFLFKNYVNKSPHN